MLGHMSVDCTSQILYINTYKLGFTGQFMENAFNQEKLLFYWSLRNPGIVRDLNAEKIIRELTEDIILYMNHVNEVKYSHQKEKAIRLDFSDVHQIAYNVGIHKCQSGWLENFFQFKNPLDEKVNEYARSFEIFKQTGEVNSIYFDEDIRTDISIMQEVKTDEKMRESILEKILKKAYNHSKREGNLLKLVIAKNLLKDYYLDKEDDKWQRAIKGDDSGIRANWAEEKLKFKRINELSVYFKKQAKINEILFKILHLTGLKYYNHPNLEGAAEEIHQKLMRVHLHDFLTTFKK